MSLRRCPYPTENDYTDAANILYSEVSAARGIIPYAEKRCSDVLARERHYVEIARRVGSRIAFDLSNDVAEMPSAANSFVAGSLTGLDLGGLAHELSVTDLSAVFKKIFDEGNDQHHLRLPVGQIIAIGNVGVDLCGNPASHLIASFAADFGARRHIFSAGVGITLEGLRELTVESLPISYNTAAVSKQQ